MQPALSVQETFIWVSAPVLQLVCVYFLYRRRLLQQFKFFASFLVFASIKAVALLFCYLYSSPQSWTYFSAFWTGSAMADLFTIAVLYELFCAAFKPFVGLQDLAKVAFKWAAGSIIMIGLMVFITNPAASGGSRYHWVMTMVMDFERIVRVMECALLMFLFIGSQHLGMSKRNRVFGFSLGFGLQAFFQLMVYSAWISSHISKQETWRQFIPLVYYISLLVWSLYLAVPEHSRESLHIPVTSPLLRWNEVALALGHSGGQVALMNSEPFMPQVERMVEQVLQKEIVERRQARVV